MSAAWPAVSLAEARARLTAPGAPFEMETATVRGVVMRVWKQAPATLAAVLEASRAHGDRTFLVHGEERLSYAEHYRAASALARALAAAGVGRGDRVAIAMRNLPEWMVAFFATTVLGAIVAPLNAWSTGSELAACLADCGARVLIADGERLDRLAPHRLALPMLERVIAVRAPGSPDATALEALIGPVGGYGALSGDGPSAVALAPDDDATLFYTSGTSGRPKGVLGTHRNITSTIVSTAYAAARNVVRRGGAPLARAAKVRLVATPLFHVTACSAGVVAGMPAGNTNVLMPRWDAGAALAIIARERVQVTGGVPTVVWQLLDHPDRAAHNLSSLEAVAYGGAPSPPDLVRRVAEELGAAPGAGWGMTETGGTVCAVSAEDYLARPASCGPPVAVAELRIMDPEGARKLPPGAVGELWAKGPMVARGYWRRPEETAAAFRDGWVRTGDLARLDEDGFCFIVDRAKDMVIRGGENIYASEVEQALVAHPAVEDAAVVALPHRTLGEEPGAVVRLAPGAAASEDDLRAWVRTRLAPFKTPVAIRFAAGPLARNAGGKLIKTGLADLFAGRTDTSMEKTAR